MTLPIGRLTRRSEFLRVARAAHKWVMPGLVVQARRCNLDAVGAESLEEVRVGFTASRKVGNSVSRNRAKRRLLAVAQQVLPGIALPGYDLVLIARAGTLRRPFADLVGDLETSLAKLGAVRSAPKPEERE